MRNIVKKQTGITLIALVITIIVLIILAGVSIAMLVGENGIITQAQRAKEETELAEQKEKEDMEKLEDEMNKYLEIIDWDNVLANAEKHPDQIISTAIGVGTDGKAVNMDLWEYNFDDVTDGYGLNDVESLTTLVSENASSGYKGTDFDNIIIPQYISNDDGETWIPVTNLNWTFYNCTELEKIESIPNTVITMSFTFRNCTSYNYAKIKLSDSLKSMCGTFYGCVSLNSTPTIPNSVNDCTAAFAHCSNITEVANLSDELINMRNMFINCTSLIKLEPKIPEKVQIMEKTFEGCTLLETIPSIPHSVKNLIKTFYGCKNLKGTIEINASIDGSEITRFEKNDTVIDYFNIFYDAVTNNVIKLEGTCTVLKDIVEYSSNSNITL